MKVQFISILYCALQLGDSKSYTVLSSSISEVCSIKTCYTQPCSCLNNKFKILPWLAKAILKRLSLQPSKKCQCKKTCKEEEVVCKYGTCDLKKLKCICSQCVTGKKCDKAINRYAPKFNETTLNLVVSSQHSADLPLTFITTYDEDEVLCKGKMCSCAKRVYKLEGRNAEIFKIDSWTGGLYIMKKVSELSSQKYQFNIKVYNPMSKKKYSMLQVSVTINGRTQQQEEHIMFDSSLNDDSENSEFDLSSKDFENREVHHRGRRSVSVTEPTGHSFIVSAVPYLQDTYYFNKGDDIKFKIKLSHNGTGGQINSTISVTVTSDILTLHSPEGTSGIVKNNMLTSTFHELLVNEIMTHNITGTVKDSVGPLSSLYVVVEAHGLTDESFPATKSTPIVFGVFPKINVTRAHNNPVACYTDLPFHIYMTVPLLNFTLSIELTSNIEEYVFMEITNVVVTTSLTYNGTATPSNYSSQNNSEIDQQIIPFSLLNVPASSSESERSIIIDFKVKVNDHEKVANLSKHWIGVGMETGKDVLWVEQHCLEIIKNEPALEILLQSQFPPYTRLYIGDVININYTIRHLNTSTNPARNIKVLLKPKFLKMKDGTPNSTFKANGDSTFNIYPYNDNVMEIGSTVTGNFSMVVLNTITPLQTIVIEMEVSYSNVLGTKKRPVSNKLEIFSATPTSEYKLRSSTDELTPGEKAKFSMSILLVKMRSPLEIEVVMPIIDDKPIFTLLSLTTLNVGSNLQCNNSAPSPQYRKTTSSQWVDQVIINFGTCLNELNSADELNNKIDLEFEIVLNEHSNITNASLYWIGAGVIGKPKMVWVGQIAIKPFILSTAQPIFDIQFTSEAANTDLFTLSTVIAHSMDSHQLAYNVTIQYHLPPFVEFVSVVATAEFVKTSNTKAVFKRSSMMYWTDAFLHSIQVRLNREKSTMTGVFEYVIPLRVAYLNEANKTFQYWKSLRRSMEVLLKEPLIPKHAFAKSEYYGRGFYWDKANNLMYVCMNQHVTSQYSACYESDDDGASFSAMDNRVGCVIGKAGKYIYAIHRNQRTYIKYEKSEDDWFVVKSLDSVPTTIHKNLESASKFAFVDIPEYIDTHGSKEVVGTGKGFYFRSSSGENWKIRIPWHLKIRSADLIDIH